MISASIKQKNTVKAPQFQLSFKVLLINFVKSLRKVSN